MLRAILIAAALLSSSSSAASSSKTTTTPKACPAGDAPGALRRLDVSAVDADVRITSGVARIVWRVTLDNTSNGPAEAQLSLLTDAPYTDRRTPVVVDGVHLVGHAAATIAARDAADERYDAFTAALQSGVDEGDVVAGSNRAAVIAALDDRGGDVVVKVAAACSQRRLVVVIDGAVQSIARPGGEAFVLPRFSAGDRIVVRSTDDAELWADGQRLSATGLAPRIDVDTLADLNEAPPSLVITVRAHEQRLRGTGVLKRADADSALLQASYEVPTTLATPPAGLHFVFVVDTSVSAGQQGIAVALRMVDRLLDAAPDDAQWSLITAGRTPRLIVGPWRARNDRFLPTLDVENGSDVPAAISQAIRIAEDVEDGAGRVIVLSDLQLKTAAEPALLAALRPTTATATATPVLHIVELPDDPDEGTLGWERATYAIADATERRGGLHVVARQEGSDDEVGLARHLIVPTRLDRPQLVIDGVVVDGADVLATLEDDVAAADAPDRPAWLSYVEPSDPPADDNHDHDDDDDAKRWPTILTAGSSLRLARLVPAGTKRVELRALAWTTPVTIALDVVDVAAAVGSVINGPLREALAPEVTSALATPLHLVSTETSLVDVPRWRPANEGSGRGMYRGGCGCFCKDGLSMHASSGIGCRIGGGELAAQKILAARANEIAERCGVDFSTALEVDDLEILDVRVKTKGTAGARRCVSEQWWQTRLDELTPGDGSFEMHATFGLDGEQPPKPETDADADGT